MVLGGCAVLGRCKWWSVVGVSVARCVSGAGWSGVSSVSAAVCLHLELLVLLLEMLDLRAEARAQLRSIQFFSLGFCQLSIHS